MVVLWSQSENGNTGVVEPIHHVRVSVTKQTLDGELSALDPDLRRLGNRPVHGGSTVCSATNSSRLGILNRTSIRLEFPVKELVERLERVQGVSYLGQVEIVEPNERLDALDRQCRVKLAALFVCQTS